MTRTPLGLAALAALAAAAPACTRQEAAAPRVGVTVCNGAHDGSSGEGRLALLVGDVEVASHELGRLASRECRSVELQLAGASEGSVRLRFTPQGGKALEKTAYVPPGYRMNFEVLGRGVIRAQATRQAEE
jgi:hypothetical protein